MDCGAWNVVCGTQLLLESLPEGLRSLIQALLSGIDPKLVVAFFFGAAGFYLRWLRRDAKIFARLEEILTMEERRLRHARSDVLSAMLRPAPPSGDEKPIYLLRSLRRILKRRNWDSILQRTSSKGIDGELAKVHRQLGKQEKLLISAAHLNYQQRNAAFLIQGAISSGRSEREKDVAQRDMMRRNAISFLNQALSVPYYEADLDALELKGRSLEAAGDCEAARLIFKELTDASSKMPIVDRQVMQIARGFYYQALCQYKINQQANPAANVGLGAADKLLNAANDKVPKEPLYGRDLLDRAHILELAARVRLPLQYWNVGTNALRDALSCYETICAQNTLTSWTGLAKTSRPMRLERKTLLVAANLGKQRCAELERLYAEARKATQTSNIQADQESALRSTPNP